VKSEQVDLEIAPNLPLVCSASLECVAQQLMTCSALARKTCKNILGDRNATHIHPFIPISEDVNELRECEGSRQSKYRTSQIVNVQVDQDGEKIRFVRKPH
jgi:gluconate kinase